MNKTIEQMSVFEVARWFSLIEAVNIIADECEGRGRDFNKLRISTIGIEKYIEGTCDLFARKLEKEECIKNLHLHLFDKKYATKQPLEVV